jgi:maleate cis-trans isomerase
MAGTVGGGAAATNRGTIAWLKPGAIDRESLDIFAMTPPDVRLAAFTSTQATNMTEREFDADAYDRRQRPEILETVRGMAEYARPAFIAVTGDLIQSTMGLPWNQSLVRDIEAATGSSAATAMTAVTDALTYLGARRVSVATPYGPAKNTYTRAYLEAAGFEVVVIEGWNAPSISIRDLKAIPDGAPLELGKRVYAAQPDTDAIFVPCPVWSVCPYISPLEQATGVPVLTILNTVIWRGLHALGHPGGVQGFGRLLEKAS